MEFIANLFQILFYLTARAIVPPLSLGRIKIVEIVVRADSNAAATGKYFVQAEYGHNPIVNGQLIWRWEDAEFIGFLIWVGFAVALFWLL